ncbi:MAG: S1 RNA-binding domain-containing protein [Lachnospiraceae bacterium]|nr:S1 RNA-binding domain-containing protein [Lachnospiraceae bacterium]
MTAVETTKEEAKADTVQEEIPSMADFEEEITRSFKRLKEGDIVTVTVIGVGDTEATVDLGSYAEGIIPLEELSNNPQFSIKADIHVQDVMKAMVISEDDGEGHVILSARRATDVVAWDKLKEMMDERTHLQVKLTEVVKSGMTAFVEGIRGFIPASQLALTYVEDLEAWRGKTVEAVIITVDESKKQLVLSAKEVAREQAEADRNSKISKLQKGIITKGIVEKIQPYGAFVNIGEGLTGLVHISQIAYKHIKSPNEVIKEGQEVKVKILDVKEGKISLSIKAAEERPLENEPVYEDVEEASEEYLSGEEATTGLGDLLKGLKFD